MKRPANIFFAWALIAILMNTAFFKDYSRSKINISSQSAILMEPKTRKIIYGKNITEKLYPASMTKIMTSILLIQYAESPGHNYGELIRISEYAVKSIGSDSSNISLDAQDEISLEDCLYALLLASANEVAVAVAERIAGNPQNFAVLMNKKAKEIGALSTNFINPHGLTEENHYTTAYDMALIMGEAIKYEAFIQAISTLSYEMDTNPDGIKILYNKNKFIQHGGYLKGYTVGGKTGYTQAAGHTLANYAENNDKQLISVVLKSENFLSYADTMLLMEYGFSTFEDSPQGSKNYDTVLTFALIGLIFYSLITLYSIIKTLNKHGRLWTIHNHIYNTMRIIGKNVQFKLFKYK